MIHGSLTILFVKDFYVKDRRIIGTVKSSRDTVNFNLAAYRTRFFLATRYFSINSWPLCWSSGTRHPRYIFGSSDLRLAFLRSIQLRVSDFYLVRNKKSSKFVPTKANLVGIRAKVSNNFNWKWNRFGEETRVQMAAIWVASKRWRSP